MKHLRAFCLLLLCLSLPASAAADYGAGLGCAHDGLGMLQSHHADGDCPCAVKCSCARHCAVGGSAAPGSHAPALALPVIRAVTLPPMCGRAVAAPLASPFRPPIAAPLGAA
jgi:hypothetical protein